MRLSTWLCSPLRPGREEVGWLLGQPLPVAEAPMAARDDGKVLHLTSYLYAANRKKGGGQAVWGPVRPDKGGPPTSLCLHVATLEDTVMVFCWFVLVLFLETR